MDSDLVLRFTRKQILTSRTECLFECNMKIQELHDAECSRLPGRKLSLGDFRGTVQRVDGADAVLADEQGDVRRVPVSRATQALDAETRR